VPEFKKELTLTPQMLDAVVMMHNPMMMPTSPF